MKINGKLLASHILKDLKLQVKKLKQKGRTPHLVVILIGNDPSSLSFIKQKQKAARAIGAKLTLHHFKKTPQYQKIAEFIHELSADKNVHGLIVQRPLPPSLSAAALNQYINVRKDVDGFLPKSPFAPPIGLAVIKILKEIYFAKIIKKTPPKDDYPKNLLTFLKHKQIVLIGRGETAGAPIAHTLSAHHLNLFILGSKSENREEYLKQADIVISAVGKANVVTTDVIRSGVTLIGVGMHKQGSKLKGDYQEKEMDKIAGFYTPMPGGTGPVNVACLMQNLVDATKLQKSYNFESIKQHSNKSPTDL